LTIRNLRVTKRVVAAVATAALGATLLALPASPVSATTTVAESRVQGLDRYATAASVAQASTIANNPNIILVSGQNYPDGLASAGLSGAAAAPILLTAPDSLPSVTANAMAVIFGSAATKTVHIIGGESAVSAGVATQVASLGYTVNRVSGDDRYETAAAMATLQASLAPVGQTSVAGTSYRTAIVATGENFADALVAGALANKGKHPILLTRSASLPAATSASLTAMGIGRVIIMGGTSAVSQEVEDAIKALGIITTRVGGEDRGATAAAFANVLVAPVAAGGLNFYGGASSAACLGTGVAGPNMVLLVNGNDYPDAMVSAPHAGICSAPILLAGSPASSAFVTANADKVGLVRTIGGTAAVSAEDATAIKTAGTLATPTGTITAEALIDVVTVEFSEKMIQGTPVVKVNNVTQTCTFIAATATMPPAALNNQDCVIVTPATGTSSTLLIDLNADLAANDLVSVSGLISATGARAMAPAQETVKAATTAPTLVVSGAVVGSQLVTLTYSRPVASIDDTQITITGPGGTVTGASGTDVSADRQTTWTVATTALVAGQTVTVGTATAAALSGAPTAIAAAVTTVVPAAGAAPKATAAVGTLVEAGGVLNTDVGNDENVIVQAKQARPNTGAGSLAIVLADPGTATAATTAASATNATTGVVTITVTLAHSGAAITATPKAVAAALNADTGTLVQAFASNPPFAGPVGAMTATAVLVGSRTLTVAITFNKALAAAGGAATTYGYDANGDTFANVATATGATTLTDLAAGKIAVNFDLGVGASAVAAPTATSTLRLAGANVTDTASQANAGQAILITS
jgi:putative cell wall-binding protein